MSADPIPSPTTTSPVSGEVRDTVDDRVLHYLSAPWNEWTETYVVANSCGMRGHTAKVRRTLRKLEAAGKVTSRDSWRHNMLEWKLSPLPHPHQGA